MATANDKNFSDARWQAQGQKLLEPTIYNRQFLIQEIGFFHCFSIIDAKRLIVINPPPSLLFPIF